MLEWMIVSLTLCNRTDDPMALVPDVVFDEDRTCHPQLLMGQLSVMSFDCPPLFYRIRNAKGHPLL